MFETVPESFWPGISMLILIAAWIIVCRLWTTRKLKENKIFQKPKTKNLLISVAGVFLILLFGILTSIVIFMNQ